MLAPIETNQNYTLFGADGHPLEFDVPRQWAALTARPSKEQAAADWLRSARMFAYWPCYGEQVRHSLGRSRHQRMRAIIPGYLFIAMRDGAQADPWMIVRQTPGITGYMRDATGYPALLGEEDIQVIRRIEAGHNLPYDPKTAHKFKVGDKVRFCGDLLGRWPAGVVSGLADNGRIKVDVPLLGRFVPIEALPHQIEAM